MRLLITFLFSILLRNWSFAINDSLSIEHIVKTNINYSKFLIEGDKLFAINDSGKLIIWNLITLDTVKLENINSLNSFLCLSRDNKNQIYLGTQRGKIYKLNPISNQFTLVIQSKYYPIEAISINNQNEILIAVPYFLYDPIKKKKYHKFYNHSYKENSYQRYFGIFKLPVRGLLDIPDYEYVDKKGNWWLCSRNGEWASDNQIFNINEKRVLNYSIDSVKIKEISITSISEDNVGNVYLTTGFEAYGLGAIYRISSDGKGTKIFNGFKQNIEPDTFNLKVTKNKDGEIVFTAKKPPIVLTNKYVGAGKFNENDASLYFSTKYGIYKAKLPQKGQIENIEKVIIPKNSEQEKLLTGLNFSQLEILKDNTIFILSKSNGIYIYKDNRLIILK
jgi:hypothetical protein